MDVQKVANLFLIFVLIAAGISLVIGFIIAVRTTNYKKGYISTFISSVVFLILIVSWYDKASSNVFMGTIPWVLNVIAVIIVLPLYVLIARFIFKKVTKGQKETKEKIIG
ncbi:uncharacterized membrane-anchored protein YhcB (DUF1043 family) [Priestia megaterium]|uniref:hypothetical protein n=1 Tax=Priestia megaterium TaxID=1404 RepID=UPI00203D4B9A|nr:hypothetical protein [Priestia megaterium]MCM3195489.1 hypothetical protein [Priestia megaterium]